MPILFNIASSLGDALGSAISELTGQGISSLASFAGLPQKENGSSSRGFGLYTEDGSVLIDFSTVQSIDVDSTNQATQAPVEAGGFVMYNIFAELHGAVFHSIFQVFRPPCFYQ